jgi:hypothetical protein
MHVRELSLRTRGGWNWLRIVSNRSVDPSGSAVTMLAGELTFIGCLYRKIKTDVENLLS